MTPAHARFVPLVGVLLPVAVLGVALSDVPNTYPAPYAGASVVLALGAFGSVLMPRRFGLALLTLLLASGQDIVSAGDASAGLKTASLWQLSLGPIRPSWLIFGLLGLHLLRFQRLRFPRFSRVLALWFVTVPIVTSVVYGGAFTPEASIEVVKDVKFALMLVASLVLFITAFDRQPETVPVVVAGLIAALMARHAADFVYVLMGWGPQISAGVTRGSLDSAKGAVALLAYYGLFVSTKGRMKVGGVTLAAMALMLLVFYGTRMLWLTFLLGVPVFLTLVGLRRSLLGGFALATVAAGGIVGATLARPDTAAVVWDRARTLTEGRPADRFAVAAEYNLISRVDPVRYAQIFNVANSLNEDRAWVWGTGYGGFYRDQVIRFPAGLGSTFPDYSFESGRFYWAHSFILYNLLKWGLVGTALVCWLWVKPAIRVGGLIRRGVIDRPWVGLLTAVLAFLPTAMLQLFWSGKGLLLNGILIALMTRAAEGAMSGPPLSVPDSKAPENFPALT